MLRSAVQSCPAAPYFPFATRDLRPNLILVPMSPTGNEPRRRGKNLGILGGRRSPCVHRPMRLSTLPSGRYELTMTCSGPCRICKTWEFNLPDGPCVLPKDQEMEDLFNSGRLRCKECRSPARVLLVESIDRIGSKRTEVLKLEGWRQ